MSPMSERVPGRSRRRLETRGAGAGCSVWVSTAIVDSKTRKRAGCPALFRRCVLTPGLAGRLLPRRIHEVRLGCGREQGVELVRPLVDGEEDRRTLGSRKVAVLVELEVADQA